MSAAAVDVSPPRSPSPPAAAAAPSPPTLAPPPPDAADAVAADLYDVLSCDGRVCVSDFALLVASLNRGNEHLTEERVEACFACGDEGGATRAEVAAVLRRHAGLVTQGKLSKYAAAFETFAEPQRDGDRRVVAYADAVSLVKALQGTGVNHAPPRVSTSMLDPQDFEHLGFAPFVAFVAAADNKIPLHALEELRTIFGIVDLDHSGLVSTTEVHQLLCCLGDGYTHDHVAGLVAAFRKKQAAPAAKHVCMQLADAPAFVVDEPAAAAPPPAAPEEEEQAGGDDAGMSFADFLRFVATQSDVDLQRLLDAHTVFRMFDASGDGEVTAKELMNVFRALGQKVTPEKLNGLMATIDVDGDGVVVFHEFLALVAGQVDTTKEEIALKRQRHLASLCGECQGVAAVIDCTECHESYCRECCSVVHSKGRRLTHSNFITIQVCGECGTVAASWECEECTEFFCAACNDAVHAKGRRRQHTQIHQLDCLRFRSVEYDACNGFGIHVMQELSIERFGKEYAMTLASEDLPPHLREAYGYLEDISAICKEQGVQYLDTGYTQQEVGGGNEESTPVPTISLGIDEAARHNEEFRARRAKELQKLREGNYAATMDKLFTWHRPAQVYATPHLFTYGNPLLGDWPSCLPVPDSLIPNLVKYTQGCFDDAWLTLCVSTIATHRDLFTNLFASTDYAALGAYAFQFYDVETADDKDAWRAVVVDNCVPLMLQDDGTLLPTFGRVEECGLWLIYLLKAYAKFRGAYSYLHRGCVPRAMVELTGGETRTERWCSTRLSEANQAYVWWRLTTATRLNLLIMCFHIPNSVEHSEVERVDGAEDLVWPEGEQVLVTVDVTSTMTADLMGVRVPGGLKFIKLRNMYGRSSVPGTWDWGPDSSKWSNKRMRKLLNCKRVDECVQWIGVRDFCKHYNTLVTLVNHPYAPFTTYGQLDPCAPGKTACAAQQFVLCVVGAGETEGLLQTLPTGDVDVDNLYSPPDFRDLEESSDEEFCDEAKSGVGSNVRSHVKSARTARYSHTAASGSQAGSAGDKKGYVIKVFVSQPSTASLTDNYFVPKGLTVNVFRALGKGVQAPEQVVGDDDVAEDRYTWPRYNMVEATQLPINEPTGNPEKQKELSVMEQLQCFTVEHPGFYCVTVEQNNPRDSVDYCLAVTGREASFADPTGLRVDVLPVGTFLDPLHRFDKYSDKTSQSQSSFHRHSSLARSRKSTDPDLG